jgi:hypothetical protein
MGSLYRSGKPVDMRRMKSRVIATSYCAQLVHQNELLLRGDVVYYS